MPTSKFDLLFLQFSILLVLDKEIEYARNIKLRDINQMDSKMNGKKCRIRKNT
jgi:hypothetical protein